MTDTLRDRLGELVREFECFAPWIIQHSDTCSYGATHGPVDDFCECGKRERVQKWRTVLQELRDAAAQPAPAVMGEVRDLPNRSELAEMSKKELVNELWGEIQTNIELNAQLRAGRTAAAESREEPPIDAIEVLMEMQGHTQFCENNCECGWDRIADKVKQWIAARQPGESPT